MGFPAGSHRPVLGAGLLLCMQGDTQRPISPGGLCQVGYVPFWFLSSYTRNAWGIWVMRKCYLAGPPGAKGSPRSCGDPVPGQDSAQVAG